MNNTELKELTLNTFKEAKVPGDKDAVMEQMFAAGIPFGKLQIMYKTVGIAEGYIADPVAVKEAIIDYLDDNSDDLAFDAWTDVEDFIEEASDGITGSTPAVFVRHLRAFCKEAEIELPKKVGKAKGGPRTRGGAIVNALIEYANSTEKLNLTGMFEALVPAVKFPRNAVDYTGTYFSLVYAVKNGISLKEANQAIKLMTQLDKKAIEEAAVTE